MRGTPESPPPPVHPNLNLVPPVHKRALRQLPRPGPQSLASPHPSSAKKARSGPRSSAAPRTVLARPHQRPLPRHLSPTLGQARPLPCALCPRPPLAGRGCARGPITPARGVGRGLRGSRRRCAFGFQVSGDELKNPARPPHSSPTAEGLHPRGAAAPDGDLPRLTCGWACGALLAPVARRWATSGSCPRRRGGGEAVSPGAQSRAPPRFGRGRGGPATQGAGPGAGPGAATRRAVLPGLGDAL